VQRLRPSHLRIALLWLALTAVMAACNVFGPLVDPALMDRTFLSVAVTEGGAARPLAAGTRIQLSFQENELSANAGCNAMGGTYHMEGSRLVFESGSMTAMACDADRDKQDQWLAAFLESKPTLTLAGNDLTMANETTVIRLLDREVADPDVAIVGPTWTLETIITGGTASSVPQGVTATLLFMPDGTLNVETGCNTGAAQWKAVGAGIEVNDLVLTKKACAGPEGQVEGAVVGVLRAGTIVAGIDAKLLTLQAGGAGLQYRAS
jgi:heat shock protein HslJ